MSALFADPLSHSAWIKSNPDRWYRITPRVVRPGTAIGWGLIDVEVMHVCEGRRVWGMQNIYMRPEIPNTDDGAKLALGEEKAIFKALLRQAHGGTRHIFELLAMLRGQFPTGAQ